MYSHLNARHQSNQVYSLLHGVRKGNYIFIGLLLTPQLKINL